MPSPLPSPLIAPVSKLIGTSNSVVDEGLNNCDKKILRMTKTMLKNVNNNNNNNNNNSVNITILLIIIIILIIIEVSTIQINIVATNLIFFVIFSYYCSFHLVPTSIYLS